MSYGLRRYETFHRLWWFVFFFICLFLAWCSDSFTPVPRQTPQLKDLGKAHFWTDLQGIGITSPGPEHSRGKQDQPDKGARPQTGISTSPDKSKQPSQPSAGQDDSRDNIESVSGLLLFIIRAGIIFLELRLLCLVVQYAGRYLLQLLMSETEDRGPRTSEQTSLSSSMLLAARIRRNPLSYVLHPFMRLRLILSGFEKNGSSEELFEKERRVVDADWRILYGSWGPYRCLYWVLPILGLAQTALLLIAQFNVASSGIALLPQKEILEAAKPMADFAAPKEILDTIKPALSLLLPLIQAVGMAVFFQLAATLLWYFEELYLSNLDAFIYDRLLSKLPVRSTDTTLILETLQQQIRDLNASLRRIEDKLFSRSEVQRPS